jgi:RHS repeat-associated protein
VDPGGDDSSDGPTAGSSHLTDFLHRLLASATVAGTGYTWSYDAVGNRTAQTVGGVNTSYTVDAADHLLTVNGAAVTSDANGSVLQDETGGAYSWDVRGRLVGLTKGGSSYLFQYGPDGLRLNKSVNGMATTYLLDGGQVVTDTINGTPNQTLYGPGTDHALARNGEFFLPNSLGSTSLLTDSGGNAGQSYQYRPFGELLGGTTDNNPFQYTGRENDGDGLLYYRARYYNPAWGRFVSADPSGFGGGINPYVYAGNNPVNVGDSSGLHGGAEEDPWAYGPAGFNGGGGGGGGPLGGDPNPYHSGHDGLGNAGSNAIPIGFEPGGSGGEDGGSAGAAPRGGAYVLRDPEWGNVPRTGRTGSFDIRAGQYGRAPATSTLTFDPVIPTDDPMEQRGAEDLLWEAYPEARRENGGLNRIRAIRLNHPLYTDYIWAGINAYFRSIGLLGAAGAVTSTIPDPIYGSNGLPLGFGYGPGGPG